MDIREMDWSGSSLDGNQHCMIHMGRFYPDQTSRSSLYVLSHYPPHFNPPSDSERRRENRNKSSQGSGENVILFKFLREPIQFSAAKKGRQYPSRTG